MNNNVLQLYAVVCQICAVGKLRIAAVITSAFDMYRKSPKSIHD